jgi:hypothetical protein
MQSIIKFGLDVSIKYNIFDLPHKQKQLLAIQNISLHKRNKRTITILIKLGLLATAMAQENTQKDTQYFTITNRYEV